MGQAITGVYHHPRAGPYYHPVWRYATSQHGPLYSTSVECATLLCLKPFGWYDLFNWTLISLFWQLITTVPPAPTSEEDLQIIEETAGIFTERNRDNQEASCFPPFYLTEPFIQRLVFLARQSLYRAANQ
ncbi:hypothetical protein BDV35DRAFT_65121 [Aspergillus flavus]|uniref:Uncharacterized protein n=1 Tax=Aspergillus flavus TaxID=5059 RepID=A0A5N6GGK0_ASPFL|nr:hypothetical protein BDV35DRAFT_65121 [Aspergillus flavus]